MREELVEKIAYRLGPDTRVPVGNLRDHLREFALGEALAAVDRLAPHHRRPRVRAPHEHAEAPRK